LMCFQSSSRETVKTAHNLDRVSHQLIQIFEFKIYAPLKILVDKISDLVIDIAHVR